jgi:hypothetical protein
VTYAARKHDETNLLRAIHTGVVATGKAVLWRNNSGRATYGVHRVQYGLGLGSADLIGLLVPSGRGIAIEVKTPIGKLSPTQIAWRGAWERAGGLYILARSVEQAIDGIIF